MAGITDRLSLLVAEDKGNFIRDSWNRLSGIPGGRMAFSKLLGVAAPYSGTIGARIEELRPGYCRVVMADRRAVRNHLRSVHAIALANLAEITGNVALAYSLPDDARFIVAGLSIEYHKKARGAITGTFEGSVPENNDKREYQVPVRLSNKAGELVATATLRTLVGPKK